MQRCFRSIAGICGALLCVHAAAGPADARRVALVIGNAEYKVGPLANPVSDAAAVAEAFGRLGFDKVMLKRNLAAEAFRAALLEMSRESAGAELGVVYFAGHGMEVAGKNFLIPVDARLAKAGDLSLEAIALDTVLEQLAGVTRLKLVILDACRNDPFPVAGARRSAARGLHRIEPEDNTLVVYAAKDGTTAEDGAGRRHSPFTEALLKHIATPGLEIGFVFRRVRDDVVAATNPVQYPHVYGTLGGKEVYLKPQASPPAAAAPAPASPAPQSSEAAERAWAAAKDTTSIAVLEAFRRQYGASNAFYDRLAEVRIDELKRIQESKKVVAPPVSPPPAAEPPARSAKPLTAAEERALKPGNSFKECDDCPEMVVVPAGSFMMGSSPAEIAALVKATEDKHYRSEGPQHTVTIARPFAVGRFEVTFAEWDACIAAGGCSHRPDDHGSGRDRRPVVSVSWDDISREYLPWLSHKTGKTYRLLTEAEWEYAARAGSTMRYHFGNSEAELCTYGNVGDQLWTRNYFGLRIANCRDGHDKLAPVGSFQPNAFGLHDMHGNVWEWVEDCWNGSYSGAPSDGSARTTGNCNIRVLRGGSLNASPEYLRSAVRYGNSSNLRDDSRGFRVGRTLLQLPKWM